MGSNLDLKDKKILFELDKNSRQSFGQLAKKVGLSKNAVTKRVSYLVESGVINSFKTLLDFGKLGYFQFNFYFDLRNADLKKEEEIIKFLCKNEIVSRVSVMDGVYNLHVELITKDIKKVYSFWEEIFNNYVNYISRRLLTILKRNVYYYRPYLIDLKKNNEEIVITTPVLSEKIDSLDSKLLRILLKGARTSIVDLSSALKVTPKTVISHMKNLTKRKIIVGYNLGIDLDKIGYKLFRVSFILSGITQQKMKEFQTYTKNHPNIVYEEEVVGGDDYEIEIHVKDILELRTIIRDIKEKFSDVIEDYKILHVFERYKGLTFSGDI